MRLIRQFGLAIAAVLGASAAHAQPVTAAGQPARLEVRAAGERSLRVTLAPVTFKGPFPENPSLAERTYPAPAMTVTTLAAPLRKKIGGLDVEIRQGPLTVRVSAGGRLVQELVFAADGSLSFRLDGQPVLGLGEGGPRPERGRPWREPPVQFDRG